MPITTRRLATASGFFERRANFIREQLKDFDDRELEIKNAFRGHPLHPAAARELADLNRRRTELRAELNRALFNAGRK